MTSHQNSEAQPVRFAVVGCGLLAQSAHLPNITALPEAHLQVCCDLNEAYLESVRERFKPVKVTRDFHAAVNDPEVDAVVIATTENFRLPVYEAACRAGKPVYTEKPLAADWEQVRQTVRMVREAGIPFCVGHNRRAAPAMLRAREILAGWRQEQASCNWRFDREGPAKKDFLLAEEKNPGLVVRINDDWYSWKNIHVEKGINAEYGLILSEMTHFVDMAQWLFDDHPVEVSAFRSGRLNSTTAVRFSQGGIATIVMCGNGSFAYPKELYELMVDGRVLVVDHFTEVRGVDFAQGPFRELLPLRRDPFPDIGREGGIPGLLEKTRAAIRKANDEGGSYIEHCPDVDKGHARLLAAFIREIRGECGAVSPVEDAARAAGVCLAAIQSLEQGCPVSMDKYGF